MKKTMIALLFVAFLPPQAQAETAEDLDRWFRDGYAALYVENSWDHADEFRQYFGSSIEYRSDDGLLELNVNEFVIDSLDGWRDEGWLGTDVAALETMLLNNSTAVFNVMWLDRNSDGSTETSCGWYVADKVENTWLLSQYIAMECGG